MQQQILPPGMKNADETDISTQVLGVSRQFQSGGGACAKKQFVKATLILQRKHVEFVRHAEDHMKIFDG
jgi:hypothetical protein